MQYLVPAALAHRQFYFEVKYCWR